MATLRELVNGLTDDELSRLCGARAEHTVLSSLLTLFDEEWAHNSYANRDLDVLTTWAIRRDVGGAGEPRSPRSDPAPPSSRVTNLFTCGAIGDTTGSRVTNLFTCGAIGDTTGSRVTNLFTCGAIGDTTGRRVTNLFICGVIGDTTVPSGSRSATCTT
jgi:hypothetical protein